MDLKVFALRVSRVTMGCSNHLGYALVKTCRGFGRRRWPFPLAILLLLAGLPLPASELTGSFSSENSEFTIYAPGSVQEIAVCRTERIFTDHRKLGFFHVQLLPVLVVQGARLELAGDNPDGNWVESFQTDWLPEIPHSAVEWRDVRITSQKENAPRLHAARAQPAGRGSALICRLQNVTLEAGTAKWQTPQAEFRNEVGRPRAVWTDATGVHHWDLFSGKMVDPQ